MGKFLHLICDYEPGDLAWSEITAALAAQLPDGVRSHTTTVPSFDTISTGFVLAQLGMAEPPRRPKDMLVFANTAPRKDRASARKNNAGEGLVYGRLSNGVELLAVNSGYSLSFVRDNLVELCETKAPDRGSQFRSRDFFPQIIAAAAAGDYEFKRRKLDPRTAVPAMPESVVAYIDCFRNIKTSIPETDPLISKLAEGASVRVTIGSTIRTALISRGSFNVAEGQLALSRGSSGHDVRFMEVFGRGFHAADMFSNPRGGDKVIVEPI